jgi:hypothetical protein
MSSIIPESDSSYAVDEPEWMGPKPPVPTTSKPSPSVWDQLNKYAKRALDNRISVSPATALDVGKASIERAIAPKDPSIVPKPPGYDKLTTSEKVVRAAKRVPSDFIANIGGASAVLGMIKAGIDALTTYGAASKKPGQLGYDKETDKPVKLLDEFKKEMDPKENPITAWLVKEGMENRKWAHNLFGLEGEAYGTGEQLASYAAGTIPIPASWLGLMRKAGGPLGRVAAGTVAAVTPVVAATKPVPIAVRSALQGGFVAGTDIAARHYLPHPQMPPIGSPEALHGVRPTDAEVRKQLAGASGVPDTATEAVYSEDPIFDPGAVAYYRENDRLVQEVENRHRGWDAAAVAAAVLLALGGAKYVKHMHLQKYGKPLSVKEGLGKAGARLIDSEMAINQAIRRVDEHALPGQAMDSATHARITTLVNTDIRGQAAEFADGNWPLVGRELLPSGVTFSNESLLRIEQTLLGLSKEQQGLFLNGLNAIYHHQFLARQTGTEISQTGLLNKATGRTMTMDEADVIIKQMFDDSAVKDLVIRYGRVGEDALKYERWITRVIGDEQYDAFQKQAKAPHFEQPIYVHGVDATSMPNFLENMVYRLGLPTGSSTAVAVRELAFNSARSAEKGIEKPLDALSSMQLYLHGLAQATTEQHLKYIVLSHLSGIKGLDWIPPTGTTPGKITRASDDGEQVPLNIIDRDVPGQPGVGRGITPPPAGAQVRYLGVFDPNAPVPTGDITRAAFTDSGDPLARKVLGIGEKQRLMSDDMAGLYNADNIMIVRRNGVEHVFQVDPFLKIALEISPHLHGFFRHGRFWTNIFTQGTTGYLSVFSPTAALYNIQLGVKTQGMRTGTVTGAAKAFGQVSYDTLRGWWEIFSRDNARIWTDFATRSVARHFGNDNRVVKALQGKLAHTIKSQTLDAIRAQGGKSATGRMNPNTPDPVSAYNVLKSTGLSGIKNSMGSDFAMSMMKTWTTLNRAFHEGTFVGMVIRQADKRRNSTPRNAQGHFETKNLFESGEAFQTAINAAKKNLGDVSKTGSGTTARFAKAWVPFSAPTIQSWAAVGSAMKSVGWAKGSMMLTGIVGVPTAAEFMANQMLMLADRDENGDLRQYYRDGRFWTQADYFWNGLSESFRVNNAIMLWPGQPPWEAAVMNISPEWALGRAVVIDMMDSLTQFSNVGNMAQIMKQQSHMWAGLARMLDVPVPPLLAAYMSATLGIDMRIGGQETITLEDGKTLSFTSSRPIGMGGGHHATGREAGRYASSFHTEKTSHILQDIFGSLATAYLAMVDGFDVGYARDGWNGAMSEATEALTDQVGNMLRITQPIFGKAHKNSMSNSINRNVYAKTAVLNELARNEFNIIMGRGAVRYPNGRVLDASTLPPPDDPIYRHIAFTSRDTLKAIKPIQKAINEWQKVLHEEGNSPHLSYRERMSRRDEIANQINALRASQLKALEKMETVMSKRLSDILQRKVVVDFSKAIANERPNIGQSWLGNRPLTDRPRNTMMPIR